MAEPDNTGPKQIETLFKPGQSGNPAGRPKGAKSKLQEDFLRDVRDAWEERGPAAIQGMIEQKPHEFVKMVAGLMPKELSLKVGELDDLTDDQLARQLAGVLAELASAGIGIVAGAIEKDAAKQTGGLQTLQ